MVSYKRPSDWDISQQRFSFGRRETVTPYISTTDRAPTPSDIEAFRKDTESVWKLYKIRARLANRIHGRVKKNRGASASEYREARGAQRFAAYRLEKYLKVLTALYCLELTQKVVTVLPREIRGMIYTDMLDRYYSNGQLRDNIIVDFGGVQQYTASLATTDSSFPPLICRTGTLDRQYKHCWAQAFCTDMFLQEFTGAFYEQYSFIVRKTNQLPAFLGVKIFDDGTFSTLPGNHLPLKYVHKLDITVDTVNTLNGRSEEHLQALLKLERKAKIKIDLVGSVGMWQGQDEDIERAFEMNRLTFSVLAAVRNKGHALTVRFVPPYSPIPKVTGLEDMVQARLDECIASAEPGLPTELF